MKIAPGTRQEIGVSFGPLGLIEVKRMFFNNDSSGGTIRFEADGRYWYWQITPCPTRVGPL